MRRKTSTLLSLLRSGSRQYACVDNGGVELRSGSDLYSKTSCSFPFEFHEFGSIGKLTVVVVDADSKLLLEIEWIRVPTVAEFQIYKFMMTLKDLCPCACLV